MLAEVFEFRLVGSFQAGHAEDVAALVTAGRAAFAEGAAASVAGIAFVTIHERIAVAAPRSIPVFQSDIGRCRVVRR